jgi:flagellar hook assembly protein FlgD
LLIISHEKSSWAFSLTTYFGWRVSIYSSILRFDLPEVSDITLTIYNMLGQKVRTFNYQNTSAGYHSVKWNTTNDYGDPVGAGVYLYQLQAKDFVKTRKMVLLK